MRFFLIIWETIRSAPWLPYYLIVKYVFLGLTILVVAAFFVLLPYAWNYGRVPFRWKNEPRKRRELVHTEVIRRQWEALIEKSESSPPDSLLQAIFQADEIIDEVLRAMDLPGEHIADRLESLSPETTKSLDRLWRAHSVKNNLTHTPGFTLTDHQARVVLGDYEAFLREIGVIN